MNPTAGEQSKKPYHAPRIEDYGNIQALTQAVGKSSRRDGGKINDRSRF